MSEIKHIFFDLDHTLWDFEENSKLCLLKIYEKYQSLFYKTDFDAFFNAFTFINTELWYQFDTKKITNDELRKTRFKLSFESLNIFIDEDMSFKMNEILVDNLQFQKILVPGTIELLNYLKPKYKLHILSNGYYDIQINKMTHSGILEFFENVFTQDVIVFRKPQLEFFNTVMDKINTSAENCIMVGDNLLADIKGATDAGIKAYYLGPENHLNRIGNLLELKLIL